MLGVLLFHGGFEWARGGFLGVSTFFTLSGFLITSLLVREWDASGGIGLARFWGRRFRRLLPAALVTIGLVGVVWWILADPAQLARLRGDMLAALGYGANWRFELGGLSYAQLFSGPSPLQHFWSLAIEEQFYLVFPLVVIGLLRAGGRRLLAGALVVGTAGSVALTLWLSGHPDRVYYGTDTRAAELLVGALLALWWSGRSAASTGPVRDPVRAPRVRALDLVGLVALGAVVWSWTAIGETDALVAHGGLALYALVTAVLVHAATRPGPVARLLSVAPLRWAGLISYGLYLYHWPVFLVLDESRVGWAPVPLFGLRMAVTLVLAVTSYLLIEMPIRRGSLVRTGRSARRAALAGAAVVAACAVLVTLAPPASRVPFADARVGDVGQTVVTAPLASPAASTVPAPAVAETAMILGDSGMLSMTPALTAALQATGTRTVVEGATSGFGLSGPGDWRTAWRDSVARNHPDLVVVMMGGWDLAYVRDHGQAAYTRLVDEAVAILHAGGARILWLPTMPGGRNPSGPVDEVYAALPSRYPGVVADPVVGTVLAGPDGAYPRTVTGEGGRTLVLRGVDGWHLCQDGAARMATAITGAAARLGWSSPPRSGWEDGPWRHAASYDDPPGGCDPP